MVSVEVVGWEGVVESLSSSEESLSLGVEGISVHLAIRVIFSVTGVLNS